jgi:hypothetical protein
MAERPKMIAVVKSYRSGATSGPIRYVGTPEELAAVVRALLQGNVARIEIVREQAPYDAATVLHGDELVYG